MSELADWVLLRTIDSKWRDHLYEMDYLREGIGLRALAQKDPLVEYKNEGFEMFQAMMDSIQSDFVRYLFHLEIVARGRSPPPRRPGSWATPAAATPAWRRTSPADRGGGPEAGRADSSAEAYEAAQASTKTVVAPRTVAPRWGATIPARAAAARSTRSAAAPEAARRSASG